MYTSGSGALTPQIEDDVIVGNINGVVDQRRRRGTPVGTTPVQIINDDFAFNTVGLTLTNTAARRSRPTSPATSSGRTTTRPMPATGSRSTRPIPTRSTCRTTCSRGTVRATARRPTSPRPTTWATASTPAALNSTTPDSQGNFVGNPAFVVPDRSPARFGRTRRISSSDSDFDLTAASAAIDNAWEATADPTDILGNSQVKIADDGWGLTGYGPRDIGAYRVRRHRRLAPGRVLPSGDAPRWCPSAGQRARQRRHLVTATSPTSITVTFSGDINPNSHQRDRPGALRARRTTRAPRSTRPASPGSTPTPCMFNLSGPLSLAGHARMSRSRPNSIESMNGQGTMAYSDNVVLQIGTPPGIVNPTPYPTPTSTPTSRRRRQPSPTRRRSRTPVSPRRTDPGRR